MNIYYASLNENGSFETGKALAETKFFTFCQNNSGGSFIINDNVSEFVIIEAIDSTHANSIAENIGIYFNGCDTGDDCPCCGDRWYPVWRDEDGEDIPLIYGEPPSMHKSSFVAAGKSIIVHYLNGEKVWF